MPDFTVIDGGGQEIDLEAEAAQDAFERFILELLRALARGDDYGYRVVDALLAFSTHAKAARAPLDQIIEAAISCSFQSAFDHDGDFELRTVLRNALRLITELMAQDSFALARRSDRRSDLARSIETYMLAREQLARRNGNRSYLNDLAADRLGKWKPTKK